MRPLIDTESPLPIARRGLMLVISSPSGAGKSTIARNLLEQDSRFSLSVSVTTRTRRASEIDGVHYHFISRDEFTRLQTGDALLEWAEVHGNLYGTPRDAAEKAMREGRDMLFDIDWQVRGSFRSRPRRISSPSLSCRPPWRNCARA